MRTTGNMKAFLILAAILFVLAMSGCGTGEPVTASHTDAPGADLIKVRDCEYVTYWVYGGRSIVHAGDCQNPIHIYRDSTEVK